MQRCKKNGGERGIRTLETVSRLHAFQACAFNHSATSPFIYDLEEFCDIQLMPQILNLHFLFFYKILLR